MFLDASAGGSLKNKNENEARDLVENMSQNEYRAQNDRGAKKKGGMLELDTQTALLAQSTLMNSQMTTMLKHFTNSPNSQAQVMAAQGLKCDFCGQGHVNGECFPEGSEEAKYLANFKRSNPNHNPYSNTYNPVTQTDGGATRDTQEVDGSQRIKIWKDVSKGKFRGRCYGTGHLAKNLKYKNLIYEAEAPHNRAENQIIEAARAEAAAARADAEAARAEVAAARADADAARAEAAASTARTRSLEIKFEEFQSRMMALETARLL
ncbi:unnamed protein product [Trifolium pratense]|uniref:Uncharacterized protein n=1 Tax=Trifolium pratense TaxID=57577 RepID=A0ACB0K943_TRIPR|nr:unnamed protein product [Trifolium pratense]